MRDLFEGRIKDLRTTQKSKNRVGKGETFLLGFILIEVIYCLRSFQFLTKVFTLSISRSFLFDFDKDNSISLFIYVSF
jgi:hypothetical protein